MENKEQFDKEVSELSDLKVLTETAGGKKLIESSKQVTLAVIGNLANNYKELSHTELITLCATLKANLDMFQLLTGLNNQIEQIKELFEDKTEEVEH